MIFGCTRHSLNKFGSAPVGTKILRSTMPIRSFECWVLSYSLLRMRLRVGQLWIEAYGNVECWIVGEADVELGAVRNVECWMLSVEWLPLAILSFELRINTFWFINSSQIASNDIVNQCLFPFHYWYLAYSYNLSLSRNLCLIPSKVTSAQCS